MRHTSTVTTVMRKIYSGTYGIRPRMRPQSFVADFKSTMAFLQSRREVRGILPVPPLLRCVGVFSLAPHSTQS